MLARQASPLLTEAEYLEQEEHAEIRHEYHQGELYMMAGGSANHAQIAVNFLMEFHAFLRDRSCRALGSDMRVKIEIPPKRPLKSASVHYVYPDFSVTCDPADLGNANALTGPKVIGEVLSPSTAAYDQTQKFELYKQLPSLEDYLLVSQTQKLVQVFHRLPSKINTWEVTYFYEQDVLLIPSLDFTCPVERFYHKVVFEQDIEMVGFPSES
ncbi:MAG: Uma2 family endonuclease [SAR324 cluster bacterium]|nr:Uma2 family endonuclease [SAR324 cluster bacterium]